MYSNEVNKNLLPKDGMVIYYENFLEKNTANKFFQSLLNTVSWKQDEVVIFGKRHITKRKTAWYGEDGLEYTYSNSTKKALPWTRELLDLKQLVEARSGGSFNSCLLNLYHSGEEGMSWHSDNEKELGPEPVIASLSLGAERKFALKHRFTKESISLILKNGSLLIMKGATQQNWLHSLPKTKKVSEPRINLTFRKILY